MPSTQWLQGDNMKVRKSSGRPQGKLWAKERGWAGKGERGITREVGRALLGRSSFHVLIIHLRSRLVTLEM